MKSHTLTSTLIAVALLLPAAAPAGTFTITRTLSFGSAGNDVRALQEILARDTTIYPEGLVTGFFGPLSRAAVQRFQAREGIVTRGDEATSGYGLVGPRTWAALSKIAGTTASPEPSGDATYSDLLLLDDLRNLRQSVPVLSSPNDSEELNVLIERLKTYVAELQIRVAQMSAITEAPPPSTLITNTCAVVNPPACTTSLIAIRDSNNCITAYRCAVAEPVEIEDSAVPAGPAAQKGEAKPATGKQGGCWLDGVWYSEGALYPPQRPGMITGSVVVYVCRNGKWSLR